MSHLNGISVVVCCYNSAGRLGPTLEHLAKQIFRDFSVEVIVVDNNSTDRTAAVATSLWSQLQAPCPLKVVSEVTPGLMNARRAGVKEASYDLLVFCDDDNWLCEDYLATVYRYFADHPDVGAIGGSGLIQATTIPYWFPAFSRQYACFPQVDNQVLYGAGMSVRARILKHIFSITPQFYLSGRVGGRLLGGDDHELGHMIFWTGYQTRYVPGLKFGHFMPAQRLNVIYLKNLMKGAGYSAPFLWPYETSLSVRLYALNKLYRLVMGFPKIVLKDFLTGRLLFLRLQMHAIYFAEVVKSALKNWGKVQEIAVEIKVTKDKYRLPPI